MIGMGIIDEFLEYISHQKELQTYNDIPTPIGMIS